MNKDLTERLKELGYPEQMINPTIQKIERFDSKIASAFKQWLETAAVPDLKIEGYSFVRLTSELSMNPINAFLTLDWLKREPKKATSALKRGLQ